MLPRGVGKNEKAYDPVSHAAEVIFGADASPVRCVIWDMSDGGGRPCYYASLGGLTTYLYAVAL